MATEYSLLTWAGLGTTVTFTDAGDIVNFTAHGAPNGHAFRFTTTGTLPTGLTAGTTYYLRQGADANKFVIHPTQADAIAGTNQVTFTGTGSGTHKVVGEYWAVLDTAGRARYGTAGSERVYATHALWVAANNLVFDLTLDVVLEVHGRWKDPSTSAAGPTGKRSVLVTSKINGVRNTDSFHYGIPGAGYINEFSSQFNHGFYLNNPNCVYDGLEVKNTFNSSAITGISAARLNALNCKVINCILQCTRGNGITPASAGEIVANNIVLNCENYGITQPINTDGLIAFNLVSGCGTGFKSGSTQFTRMTGVFLGNIAIGNTVNWGLDDCRSLTATSRFYGSNNFGDTSDDKVVTFTSGGTLVNIVAHGLTVNTRIFFKTSNTLPPELSVATPYYVKTINTDSFTIASTFGGTAITFSNAGTGVHTFSMVWDTAGNSGIVSSVNFIDYANKNFKPALVTSPQVELITLTDGDGLPRYDCTDAVRPNYEASSFPNNKATAGPFEFDHGEGTVPNYKDITLTGLISGSRVKIKKTSDGTSIYNDVVGATTLTVSYNLATDTGITVDIRKGSASPFYYPYRTTATVSALTGLTLSISQIPDIACSTYRSGIADDWDPVTLEHIAGTTVDDVQDLYSYLCDYYDDSTTIDADIPLYGTTSTVFGLQNGGTISDADMQYLKGGSIQDGTTLWANVYTVGSQAAATPIYIHVDGVEYTSFWPDGNIDVLLKFPSYDGTEVVDIRAHKYSDTYDHWSMTVTDGRNVAAISTSDDPDNQTAEATVSAYGITITTDNPTDYQIDASDTPGDYTATIDLDGLGVLAGYEYGKYLDKAPSTYTSIAGFPEVKTAPRGTFAAGVWSVAPGYRIINVAASDALNYILTDNDGVTHQAAAPPVQILVTNLVDGECIQIYDLTNDEQLDVGFVTGTTYSLEKTWTEDLDIRVRHIFVDGVTATKFQEEQGEFTATGMNLRASQESDTVYNTNAIDGSLVTGVEIIDGTLRVQVSTGSISWQQLYAYETYWLSTEAGIIDEGRYAVAVDVANYLWYDFKLKNVTFPIVPLVVTGGYGKDGDTGTSLDMLDTTGGTIILAPDHVVPYSSGAEATVAIVQAGLQAQGYTTTRAPKLDNLDIPVSEAGGGGGGLTTEEHDRLMNTLTVSKFIGLK